MLGAARCVFMAQPKPSAGLVKDGTPTDDAVPAGFTSPVVNHSATGDGSADDTSELGAALGHSSLNAWLAPGEDYRITGTVTTGNRDLVFYGARILYDRSQNDGVALRIGPGQVEARKIHGVRVINQNQSDWSNDLNAGLDILNIADCIFTATLELSGFTSGIRHRSDDTSGTTGASYVNVLGIGEIKNCKRGIWTIEDDPVGGAPWINGCAFFGGLITVEAGVNNGEDRYGIIMDAFDDIIDGVNYFGTGFELAEDGAGNAVLCSFIGWSHGLVFYVSADSGAEEIEIRGESSNFGMWSTIFGTDTAAPVTLTAVGTTFGEQYAVDNRRALDGAAADNLEDLGGVID